MSQEELAMRGKTTTENMSFIERVKSWGKKPEIAHARTPAPPPQCKSESYNLRCRYEQEPMFDMAMTVMSGGKTVRLKKTTIEKIDCQVPTAVLVENNANGQADWILVDIGSRKISIKRRSLDSALQALGIIQTS